MIASKFCCEEVRIENLEDNYDYSWLISQQFKKYTVSQIIKYNIEDLEKYSYTYFYRVKKNENDYSRSQIDGVVAIEE
jgi:hypothetical protein